MAQEFDATPARPFHILPVIVLSQFAGTSLWFAGNVVAADLAQGLSAAWLVSAVQLGFISGTVVSAWLRLADRYSANRLFLCACCAGALFNDPLTVLALRMDSSAAVLALRFLVGVSLAGIYPIGIRAAAGWYRQGLGKALGYLTAALVLGTAFPHLVRGLGASLSWQTVLHASSLLALLGGLVLYWTVPEGPHLKRGSESERHAMAGLAVVWRQRPRLRAAACGYFGHMWELYAFWAFVPVYLAGYFHLHGQTPSASIVSLWSFAVIAAGVLGCVIGGEVSQRRGSASVAATQLSISCACCLLSPLAYWLPTPLYIAFLLLWGIAVVGDSAQFSALNAQAAPPQQVGSVITLVNCIGFSITVVSIQLTGMLAELMQPRYLLVLLAVGPLAGLGVFVRGYSNEKKTA
ncbi:MFS transporter [Verticiella sediminum]|uniref:MFS transporter n=1 Tax=Verticiella sediminum TaxID=1247510 RepID=A0A556A831_9BURK|nr:MFS transporter [Verticiella sediminum]TSH89035.1 MFS transporter [Verticiella sediminum]